ncbi:helix-turn-helix domain-containing protein [Paenibacillus sinopodophylli]|uniref:helix-turn-helix domain-containing protein n=1 Tax=Paenibacillus sinopodophylli TaxID=1837342 RepID=UPI001486D120|nr:helix-turn-helix transcriptional regulator [Paenibacillus sinopodophylli]
MITIKEIVGKRIEYERLRNEWTQDIVAKKIGVARPTYANYEAGKRQPSIDNLKQLAEIFNVTTDYLTGHSDIRNGLDMKRLENINMTEEKKLQLYTLLEKMNKDQIEHVLKTVQFIIKD